MTLLALLSACQNDARAPETAATTNGAAQPAAPSVSEEEKTKAAAAVPDPAARVLGAYAGELPCADCAGIRTELTLDEVTDLSKPAAYRLRETYLGAKDGEKTVESAGTYTITLGAATSKTAVVYQLNPDKSGESRLFLRVDDNRLRLLDKDRKELPGDRHLLTKNQ